MPLNLFFSVGEPSGDLHAANLIAQLRRHAEVACRGLGGPRMQAAGCDLLRDMSDLAVMGLFPVIAKLPEFLRLKAQVARTLDERRPDAVVLIDYPGFNWHVARLAKQRGIPVFYYGLPQLWAWASWRVRKVQQYVDHALCKLPFEEAWFNERGCHATYVGHPYFDELSAQKCDATFMARVRERNQRLLTLLPGSRTHEVKWNLPLLLKAAARVQNEVDGVQVAVASYNARQAELAETIVAQTGWGTKGGPPTVHVARTTELISAADCCLACSGSVSLELLYHATPAAIVYRVSWPTYQLVRRLLHVRYITLANLIASRRPFDTPGAGDEEPLYPEYPTWRDCSEQLAGHAVGWLSDENSRQQLIGRLSAVRQQVAGVGASSAAAQYLLKQLGGVRPVLRKAS